MSNVTKTVESIAAAYLGFETLTSRGSDHLDFRTVSAPAVKAALVAAYVAGLTTSQGRSGK